MGSKSGAAGNNFHHRRQPARKLSGFIERGVGAGGDAFPPFRIADARAEQEDGSLRIAGMRSQATAEFQPVQIRQRQVEAEQGNWLRARDTQGLFATQGTAGSDALSLEQKGEQAQAIAVIFDD